MSCWAESIGRQEASHLLVTKNMLGVKAMELRLVARNMVVCVSAPAPSKSRAGVLAGVESEPRIS